MSDDANIELLRDIYGDWARGEFKRADIFDAEVEFVTSGVDSRTYHGVEGVVEGWFDFLSAWTDFRVEAGEIIPGAQEGCYVVFVHLSGRGRESGVPTESETANVVWMHDSRIRRLELHWDHDAALESAGASYP
jgi:ketosteroid isomerase-like protein